jgi:hypothetical protein
MKELFSCSFESLGLALILFSIGAIVIIIKDIK